MKLNFILKASDGELVTNKVISDSDYRPKTDDIIDFAEHLNKENIQQSITTYKIDEFIYRLIGDDIEVSIKCYPVDINHVERLLPI